jgi:hypothetical protein
MERMSDRATVLRAARRKGFLDGAASIFYVFGQRRPAPPLVRRRYGTLTSDVRELRRDSDRIISAGR